VNVDLVHFDYPAAAQSRAATVGGISAALWPSTAGRWNNSGVPTQEFEPEVYPADMCSKTLTSNEAARKCKPPIGVPWRLPYDVSPVAGPIATYRGTVGSRLFAPPANVSLPPIARGSWDCNMTSIEGAYIGRPVCRAACDSPENVAVDLGIERWASENEREMEVGDSSTGSARNSGFRLAVSTVRIWWTFWTGLPSLVQGTAVLPRQDH